jgi:leucyl-tRNA synthetase
MAVPVEKQSEATLKLENTEKRDFLIEIEKKYQKQWQDAKLYEVNAPSLKEFSADTDPKTIHEAYPKHFGTQAYPYTNGTAHLGHAFTVSKYPIPILTNGLCLT